MTVLILRAVSPGMRGELSRWMLEVDAGVFVGAVPARIREKLWERIFWKLGADGAAVMINSATTEQGFVVRSEGVVDRAVTDHEGLALTRFKQARRRSNGRKP
jgi:CRISPR-associated protein Cas2